ncbi:ADP-ribosylglycohydrolase family protein [Dactylosporangium cerinum]|uniref:ADP-ribosylglycohydrolase family protein n=1 Tax=Dactylosporangium cerinum TaxID=1434730 RepID=A0ABV9WBP1_9ACTN
MVGSAVGDALGAPFEFGPAGAFRRKFPDAAEATMEAGGGWEAGEGTDDTQMALLVADSLLERGGFDGADMFERFCRWVAAEPKDVGLQTEAVLTSGLAWDLAAADHAAHNQRAAGNGSLMRTVPAAVFHARGGRAATMDAARRISALTHGDPAAGEGCAIYHELLRVALDGGDPLDAVDGALDAVAPAHRARWARVLAADWDPDQATESNGAVWPTLGCAVWAVRTCDTYAEAVAGVIDLGGDTDTLAAVTGGLAGAVHGVDDIPEQWRRAVFVPVPGFGDRPRTCDDLAELAKRLDQDRPL